MQYGPSAKSAAVYLCDYQLANILLIL